MLMRLAITLFGCIWLLTASAFEKIAILDTYDFCHYFDTETSMGLAQVVDHVLLTGADRIIQRHHSGGLPRYPTKEEDLTLQDAPLDRRRLPGYSPIASWLSYASYRSDQLLEINRFCKTRGVATGVHYTMEEAHNSAWSLDGWNLAHPQYWCRGTNGVPWHGHCSIAYPEVLAHKLAVVDEIIARGGDFFYIDPCRYGGWSPRFEYVEPVLAEWHRRHGDRPPPKNPKSGEWLEVVSMFQHGYIRAIRARLDAAPRKIRLVMGVEHVGHHGEGWTYGFNWFCHAIDWRVLRDEGVIDAIAAINLRPEPSHLWEDTERICRNAVAYAKCPVYFPIMQYNFAEKRPGYPQYAKWSGLGEAEVVRRLLRIAADAGAAGITMECVDYRNYSPEVCKVIREFKP